MEIPRNIKIGVLVISGIAFAFLAGYVIFSYFSRDRENVEEAPQITSETPTEVESDTEGIEPIGGSVAGATDDSSGISQTPGATGSISNQNTTKGGVLGQTSVFTQAEHEGIVPTYGNVQKNTITPEDRADYKKKEDKVTYEEAEDDNDDSEITASKYPEVEEHEDYTEYTYTFYFNDDAQDRYEDGFNYTIDADSCDDSDYFTSSKYDFSGTINDVEEGNEIVIRIKNDYIEDEDDFEDADYRFDGKKFVVRGEIKVPQCED